MDFAHVFTAGVLRLLAAISERHEQKRTERTKRYLIGAPFSGSRRRAIVQFVGRLPVLMFFELRLFGIS